MKEALIDGILLVRHTDCFSCRGILISSIVFLDIPAHYSHIDWSYELLRKSTRWRWTRTGNAECKRLCDTCAQRRKQSIQCVLKSGYTSVFPQQDTISTLPDLLDKIGLGSLLNSGIKKGLPDNERRVFITVQNVLGKGHLDFVEDLDKNRMRPSYCIQGYEEQII